MTTGKDNWQQATPIQKIHNETNFVYIKRDDLLPLSFGGNKVRKAELFFRDMEEQQRDCIVTYGVTSSNHCRVIANMAARKGIPCWIVSPNETNGNTFNKKMVHLFGAKYVFTPVSQVHETIEQLLFNLKREGYAPYFVQGGGHGNLGTQAYINAYHEICEWENEHGMRFDYIFHASGTGTTQAGLVCGQLLRGDLHRRIVGISIARTMSKGRSVVVESVKEYLSAIGRTDLYRDDCIFFDDSYICGGYGIVNDEIRSTVICVLKEECIPLCGTYTGKAFWGMESYLKLNQICNKNILFIHTGGTPLFFDDVKDL